MFEPVAITLILLTFVFAGMIKGVIGLGLPTFSLGMLTMLFDLPTAMAIMIVPSLVTNIYQASVGGNTTAILVRLWPFLLLAGLTVPIGTRALSTINLDLLTVLLGALLAVYAIVNLLGRKLVVSTRQEAWVGPLLGAVNGIFTGMTGSFVVPGVMYLQAIGLGKDMLVQAMGMLFTISTLALAIALQSGQYLSNELGLASLLGLVPAIAGMYLGQKLRERLSEARFRRVFFVSVLVLGVAIGLKAV